MKNLKGTLRAGLRPLHRVMILSGTSLLVSGLGWAQDWRLVAPPPPANPSSVALAPNDASRVFLSAETDGVWEIKSPNTTFRWTFVTPYTAACPDPNTCPHPGLYEVHMTRFLAAPNTAGNQRVLYVLGAYGHVEISRNDGGSWASAGNPDPVPASRSPWAALAIDPVDATGNTLLAGGLGMISLSLNGGANWDTRLNLTATPRPVFTDIEYANPQYVWAATADAPAYPEQGGIHGVCSGVYRSVNYGYDWTPINVGAGDANCVYAIAPFTVAQNPGNGAYAATKGGLWRTTDGGASWQPIALPAPVGMGRVADVFYAPLPTPTVYAAAALADPNFGAIYQSTNGGQSWSLVTGLPNGAGWRVNAIGGTPLDSNTLYVAYGNGEVHKVPYNQTSRVSGAHAGYPMATVAIIPPNPETDIYVGMVCQGGVYQKRVDDTWRIMTQPTVPPNLPYVQYHYAMRLVQHPTNRDITYVTDGDAVWCTQNGGTTWQVKFLGAQPCLPPQSGTCSVHLHGLAMAPSMLSRLYVGSGYGNWGTHSHGNSQNRVWRANNGGANAGDWAEVTGPGFPQPPANSCCHVDAGNPTACQPSMGPCQVAPGADSAHCGCSSVYSLAVSPSNPHLLFAGTFGSENDPGKTVMGRGLGVARGQSTDNGNTFSWATINNGLCPDGMSQNCLPTAPTPGSLSLFVGTVVIDKEGNYVYIATLNGIYSMPVGGNTWTDIVGNQTPTRRFEAIAVDPNNSNILYAGTSELGINPPGNPPPAKIFKGLFDGVNWTWQEMTFPTPAMQPLAWSDRYRVRDIQAIAPTNGQTKAYAVIEGSGIYSFNQSGIMRVGRR